MRCFGALREDGCTLQRNCQIAATVSVGVGDGGIAASADLEAGGVGGVLEAACDVDDALILGHVIVQRAGDAVTGLEGQAWTLVGLLGDLIREDLGVNGHEEED